eukprot:g6300.t1
MAPGKPRIQFRVMEGAETLGLRALRREFGLYGEVVCALIRVDSARQPLNVEIEFSSSKSTLKVKSWTGEGSYLPLYKPEGLVDAFRRDADAAFLCYADNFDKKARFRLLICSIPGMSLEPERRCQEGRSAAWQGACIRLAVVLGAIFHLMLALPLPPASFYPFSASCLALYPLLVPGACEQLAKRLSSIRLAKLCWIALPGLMLAICAAANRSGAWSSWLKGGHHDVPFEYPPYDLYNAGICWCFGVTAFLVVLALLGPGQEKQKEPVSRATSVAVAATLLLGLGPYLGTRTYPAFAMFSNLRVERAPNHLLLNGGFDVLGLQSDVVEVLDTNSSDLRSFQVDLSQLFTAQTQSYFTDSKLTKALWICPPRWSHEVKDFQPFSAPALGLWQRLISESPSFYARIRRGGVESTIYSRAELKGRCRKDIPAWMCEIAHYVLGPFRAFDGKQSPCRH